MDREISMGSVAPDVNTAIDCGPYLLPTYAGLMMRPGGGFDLEAASASQLEKQIEQYIAEYRNPEAGDVEWNNAILASVSARDFVPYVNGSVRARWPGEEGMTIH